MMFGCGLNFWPWQNRANEFNLMRNRRYANRLYSQEHILIQLNIEGCVKYYWPKSAPSDDHRSNLKNTTLSSQIITTPRIFFKAKTFAFFESWFGVRNLNFSLMIPVVSVTQILDQPRRQMQMNIWLLQIRHKWHWLTKNPLASFLPSIFSIKYYLFYIFFMFLLCLHSYRFLFGQLSMRNGDI